MSESTFSDDLSSLEATTLLRKCLDDASSLEVNLDAWASPRIQAKASVDTQRGVHLLVRAWRLDSLVTRAGAALAEVNTWIVGSRSSEFSAGQYLYPSAHHYAVHYVREAIFEVLDSCEYEDGVEFDPVSELDHELPALGYSKEASNDDLRVLTYIGKEPSPLLAWSPLLPDAVAALLKHLADRLDSIRSERGIPATARRIPAPDNHDRDRQASRIRFAQERRLVEDNLRSSLLWEQAAALRSILRSANTPASRGTTRMRHPLHQISATLNQVLGLPDPQTAEELACWCRRLQKHLVKKDEHASYMPDGLRQLAGPTERQELEVAWTHLRRIAGTRPIPEAPREVCSTPGALERLERVVNWCNATFHHIDDENENEPDGLRRNTVAGVQGTEGAGSASNNWGGEELLSPRDLARRFAVSKGALDSRLIRWRQANPAEAGKGWVENADRGSRQPKHLYRLGSVRHIIEALRLTSE